MDLAYLVLRSHGWPHVGGMQMPLSRYLLLLHNLLLTQNISVHSFIFYCLQMMQDPSAMGMLPGPGSQGSQDIRPGSAVGDAGMLLPLTSQPQNDPLAEFEVRAAALLLRREPFTSPQREIIFYTRGTASIGDLSFDKFT